MMKANRILTLIALLGLCLSVAGIAQTTEKAGTGVIQVDRPARILDESDTSVGAATPGQQTNSGNILRCWQHGHLLYEGDGFSRVSPAARSTVTVVTRRKGENVSLINLNEGFCVLSDH